MQDMYYDDSEEAGASGVAYWIGLAVKWGGAALSLGLIVLLIVWAWRLGAREPGEVPVIRALGGEVRITPEDPGGQQQAHQGLEVNDVLAGREAQLPEEVALAPAPQGLAEEDAPQPLVVAPPEGATPQPNAESAPSPSAQSATPPTAESATPPESEALASPPGQAAPLAPVEGADAGSVQDLQSLIDQAVEQAEAEVQPRARPEALSQSAPAAPPPGGAEVETAAVPSGTRTVQLGAFDSLRDARTSWDQMLRVHGDLLGARSYYVQEAESNGRVFFRLRVLGFSDAGEQNGLCEALRARAAACIPVTVN